MARQPRNAADDCIYHVFNRGNCKMDIFTKPGDFESFIKLLEEGRRRFNMRILGYILMDNHWHLALWPRRGEDLARFMQWVSTTHVRRWREHRGNVGQGHLYQGRFKSFIVQNDAHLLSLMIYIESNALRARMVKHAEDWPWSSLRNFAGADDVRIELSPWPVDRPRDWKRRVNRSLDGATLERLALCIKRGRPFGEDKWVAKTAKRLDLESTLRDPWRPRKAPAKDGKPRAKK
jgi:putative transposase